jgi:outer membrane protein TolC
MTSAWVYSQDIDYNKIVLPEKVKSSSFEEQLVQLAWKNHPSNKVVLQDVELARHEKTLTKFSWLDNIYAAGNVNEFTLNPSADLNNRSNFFPKYNFGIRVSIGTIVTTPMEVRVKQDHLLSNQFKVNQKMIEVRSQVLTSLERLKEQYKLLRLRQRMEEDFLIMYNDAEKKFSAGQIDISAYRESIQAYSGRSEEVIQTKSQFNQAKIAVEALVGVKLDEIDGYNEYLKLQEKN